MHINHRLLEVSRFLFIVFLASGCSAGGDGGGGAGGNMARSNLKIATWWVGGGELEALTTVIDALHHDDVVVETLPLPQDMASRRDAYQSDLVWDVGQENFSSIRTSWCRAEVGGACEPSTPASQFQVRPLSSVSGLTDALAKVSDEIRELVSVGDEVMAIPMNVHRENTLHYAKVVTSAPTTLTELHEFCDAYVECVANDPAACDTYAYGITGARPKPLAIATAPWVHRIWFNSMLPPEVVAGSSSDPRSAFVSALATIQSFYDKECLWIAPQNVPGDEHAWGVATQAVIDGEALMIIHGDWAKGLMIQSEKAWEPGLDFHVASSPGSEGAFYFGIDVFGLNREGPNGAQADRFARLALSEELQVAFSASKGSTPAVLLDSPEDLIDDPTLLASYDDLQEARANQTFIAVPAWLFNNDAIINKVIPTSAEAPGANPTIPGAEGMSPECLAQELCEVYPGGCSSDPPACP